MRNFDLYVSGILYGRLRLGDGTTQIRKLDVHTGALLDWQDLTEQDRDFYRFFVKMDFAALGQNLSQYESGLHGTGEVSLVRRALHQRRRLQLPAARCKIPPTTNR